MLFSYIVNNPISSADVVLSASFSFFARYWGRFIPIISKSSFNRGKYFMSPDTKSSL